MTLINFLFFWSWTSVSFLIGDGGDNLLRVMFPYLLLTDLFGKIKEKPTTLWQRSLGILHNFGLYAIILQLCIVYFTAGLMKVQGSMWQDGTALYYIFQVDEFRNPLFSDFITNHIWISVIGSYFTIFFQLAFPFLILHPKIKPYVVLTSIALHFGIWITMNLPSFSWIMIAFELPFLSNSEYRKMIVSSNLRLQHLKATFLSIFRKQKRTGTIQRIEEGMYSEATTKTK